MREIIFFLCFLLLLLYSCGPKKVNYEQATKWYSDCTPHPDSHPADIYAYSEICIEECKSTTNANNDSPSLPKESSHDSGTNIYGIETDKIYATRIQKLSCISGCIEKINPMATHIEGGYYSDGSYYAMCMNPFENIHPNAKK